MVWNVFYYNINHKQIETYNVFQHGGFRADVQKYKQQCAAIEEFAEELRSSLLYYFWSKCEWEILISPWPSEPEHTIKVDVYTQVMQNWQVFLDYVWGCNDVNS